MWKLLSIVTAACEADCRNACGLRRAGCILMCVTRRGTEGMVDLVVLNEEGRDTVGRGGPGWNEFVFFGLG